MILTPDTIGFIAASCTTLAFVPQAITCLRTGRTDGLSLPMYVIFSTGVALWLAYGIATEAWPVAISNAATLIFALMILTLILRNRWFPPRTKLRARHAEKVVGG